MDNKLKSALLHLATDFKNLPWDFYITEKGDRSSSWLGRKNEDVAVLVMKTNYIKEPFHHQDFFFLNYCYKGTYSALSQRNNHLITLHEDECYLSQPYAGYALRKNDKEEAIVIGVLIKKDYFYSHFLSLMARNPFFFRFFLLPPGKENSEDYLYLSFKDDMTVRKLLESMVMEYALGENNSQEILGSLSLAAFLMVVRRYQAIQPHPIETPSLKEKLELYIKTHINEVSLTSLAKEFSYHPSYLSTYIHKNFGISFSKLVLENKMKQAQTLLFKTSLTNEEISDFLGYQDPSNFYRDYQKYYRTTPRRKKRNC